MKKLWSTPEFREKNLPNLQKGVEVFQEKVGNKPWVVGRASWTRKNVWPFAQQFYEIWVEEGMPGRQLLSNLVGVDSKSLKKMHEMFQSGWIPEEDCNWTEDFRFGEYIGEFKDKSEEQPVFKEDAKLKISESLRERNAKTPPWEFSRAKREVWASADILHDYYTKTLCGYKNLATAHDLPGQSCKTIHKKFKSGWNPKNDVDWVKEFKGGIK